MKKAKKTKVPTRKTALDLITGKLRKILRRDHQRHRSWKAPER
jgi:hypothetical protein